MLNVNIFLNYSSFSLNHRTFVVLLLILKLLFWIAHGAVIYLKRIKISWSINIKLLHAP